MPQVATAAPAAESAPRNILSVSQFAARWPAWSQASLRNLIFQSHQNGLDDSGAILRLGRRRLIDEQAFFRWLAQQQKRTRREAA